MTEVDLTVTQLRVRELLATIAPPSEPTVEERVDELAARVDEAAAQIDPLIPPDPTPLQ